MQRELEKFEVANKRISNEDLEDLYTLEEIKDMRIQRKLQVCSNQNDREIKREKMKQYNK